MTGRSVIVTGGGSGMGAAMVRAFAGEGDRVAALDLNLDAAKAVAADIGGECIAVPVDVGDAASVTAAVAEVARRLGPAEVLCCNAGILDDYLPVTETSHDLWDRILATDLTGPYLMAKAVLPAMIDAGGGVIINTASISAFIAGGGGAAYTAAKHGLVGLTRQMAFDHGKQNIRVNAICPGPVRTGMTEHLFTEAGRQPHVDAAIASIPAGRWADPGEIASLALYLASDAASFIHGAAYLIDGGWTIS